MHIKIYLVTYKGHHRLNKTLKSLLESDIDILDYEINIINNHTDLRLNDEFLNNDKINVLHNSLRPDFSDGHLSRNWNQGIINGFKNPNNPDCDMVLNVQDDVLFRSDCFSKLEKLHDKYDLIQNGQGDTFVSYKIEAVKNVGLWDERFCNISYQVADYFYRCKVFYPEKCSINDAHHGRILNPILPNKPLESQGFLVRPSAREIGPQWNQGDWNVKYSRTLFNKKWNNKEWKDPNLKEAEIESYIFYPYFEKHLSLKGKKYFGI